MQFDLGYIPFAASLYSSDDEEGGVPHWPLVSSPRRFTLSLNYPEIQPALSVLCMYNSTSALINCIVSYTTAPVSHGRTRGLNDLNYRLHPLHKCGKACPFIAGRRRGKKCGRRVVSLQPRPQHLLLFSFFHAPHPQRSLCSASQSLLPRIRRHLERHRLPIPIHGLSHTQTQIRDPA